MRSGLAQAIRDARVASGLTQEELGRRLGLKGRAVYRWERDDSVPRSRHRQRLVTAIGAVNQAAANALATVLASYSKRGRRLAQLALASTPATTAGAPNAANQPAIDEKLALELAVFALADELDVPARRVRGALIKLLGRLRETGHSLETAQRQLATWNETAAGST